MNYLEWLKKEKYELETTVPVEDLNPSWSRKSVYGAPKCSVNNEPVDIVVTKVDDKFVMSVRASAGNYWANLEAYDISEEFLVKRGRAIEHRLVSAWMELAS